MRCIFVKDIKDFFSYNYSLVVLPLNVTTTIFLCHFYTTTIHACVFYLYHFPNLISTKPNSAACMYIWWKTPKGNAWMAMFCPMAIVFQITWPSVFWRKNLSFITLGFTEMWPNVLWRKNLSLLLV